MRIDEMTDEDFKLLKSRVRDIDHEDISDDALFVMCTNKEVDKINQDKLNKKSK